MTNRKTGDEDVEWYWDWISGVGGKEALCTCCQEVGLYRWKGTEKKCWSLKFNLEIFLIFKKCTLKLLFKIVVVIVLKLN